MASKSGKSKSAGINLLGKTSVSVCLCDDWPDWHQLLPVNWWLQDSQHHIQVRREDSQLTTRQAHNNLFVRPAVIRSNERQIIGYQMFCSGITSERPLS